MDNKRRHKRYSVTGSAAVKYEFAGQSRVIHALITDISLSGVGLYLDVPLEDSVDVLLEISFLSNTGSIEADKVSGCIVYVKKFQSIYFTGIQFHEEISRNNQPALFEHLNAVSLLDG